MTKGRAALVACAMAVAAAALPANASAEETTCRGTLGKVTVDNLRVPDGARCSLKGTRVKGTIKVETAAKLDARRVRVVGNVQAENALRVVVRRSRIGGSVQVNQSGAAKVIGSRVKQDILYDANVSKLTASRNRVGGSIQVFQNTGGVAISRNRVIENLQCKENSPSPTGGGNVVHGSKQDQCSGL